MDNFKDAGFVTLVAFISPFRRSREFARQKIGPENFIEVYVKASLDTCSERDPKGLYAKALKGEIFEFTGITSPYEEPENPDLILDTEELSVDEAVHILLKLLEKRS